MYLFIYIWGWRLMLWYYDIKNFPIQKYDSSTECVIQALCVKSQVAESVLLLTVWRQGARVRSIVWNIRAWIFHMSVIQLFARWCIAMSKYLFRMSSFYLKVFKRPYTDKPLSLIRALCTPIPSSRRGEGCDLVIRPSCQWAVKPLRLPQCLAVHNSM